MKVGASCGIAMLVRPPWLEKAGHRRFSKGEAKNRHLSHAAGAAYRYNAGCFENHPGEQRGPFLRSRTGWNLMFKAKRS